MKITIKKTNKPTFHDLNIGDCFSWYFDDAPNNTTKGIKLGVDSWYSFSDDKVIHGSYSKDKGEVIKLRLVAVELEAP